MKRNSFLRIALISGICSVVLAPTAVIHAADPQGELPRIVVKFNESALLSPQAVRDAVLAPTAVRYGVTFSQILVLGTGGFSYQVIGASSDSQIDEIVVAIQASELVEYAERVLYWQHTAFVPNDAKYNEQWHYYRGAGGIRLPAAWDVSNGSGINVAVIDTGVVPHADLSPNVLSGYDMISSATTARDGNGRDSNPRDEGNWQLAGDCPGSGARNSSWHGTHVAGTVAAVTNNSIGVAGVAFGARIVPVRVLGRCGGTFDDIADAIIWASGGAVPGIPANPTPARVLNLSLGCETTCACPQTVQAAINIARDLGANVVVAAGNRALDASGFAPANCQGVVTVAATNRAGGRASYSNFGTIVDIAAPGGETFPDPFNGVLSTVNTGTTIPTASPGGDAYAFYQGTSMAAPHVAGTIALIRNAEPNLTRDQVEQRLLNTARAFPTTCTGCGAGIVNAAVAVGNGSDSPWQSSLHDGDFDVETQTTKVKVSWPAVAGKGYDICVTVDPATDVHNCLATPGNQFITSLNSATSQPYTIGGLTAGVPVYLALLENGAVKAWTSATPNVYGVDGVVFAQVLGADGTRYVGGNFTSATVITGGGVTLRPHSPGSSFASHALAFPQVNATVYASVPDGDGGWYIGGSFDSVGGQPRQYLAQVDRLGRVTAWNPGANNIVYALAVDAGVIYAGGAFTSAGGGTGTQATRNRLAAFDTFGALTAWNPGANSSVTALAVNGSVIYAGGNFTAAGGGTGTQATRKSLAAFDIAGALTDWNPGTSAYPNNSIVRALAVNAGVIYAGGDFTSAGGGTGMQATRYRLAAFDTVGALAAWNPGASGGDVKTLAVDAGVIYAGGNFTAAGGGTGTQTPRLRLAAFDTAGALTAWNPGAAGSNTPVYTLAVNAGVIYAGGSFTSAGGGTGTQATRNRLAAFDASGALTAWNPGANNAGSFVLTLAVNAGVIYAGGYFTSAGGGTGAQVTRTRLAGFDAAGDLTAWNPGANSSVYALAVNAGVIYAGGWFTTAGGGTGTQATRNFLAAFDTAGALTGWNPGASSYVYALALDEGVIYAGGGFTTAGGGTGTQATRNRLAAFDTAGALTGWNPGANGYVNTLAVNAGVIYAGGEFTTAGGASRARLGAFDTTGVLTGWNPGANNNVMSLTVNAGLIYAGGNFTSAGGGTGTQAPRNRLAAFDAVGALTAWNPGANNWVQSLAVNAGVIYAGGYFTAAGGGTGTQATRKYLAAFDATGVLTAWNPGATDIVRTLAVDAGVIYAGGYFTTAGGGTGTQAARYRLAAFDTSGALAAR